uniref:Putative enoyl-coa hydratase/isomerase n=2 Tax=Anopheles marajoara TaxID=58244 RepID=A0A2M4BVQ1_9DIPT
MRMAASPLNGFDETLNKCIEQLKQITCSKTGAYVEVRLNSCGVLPQAGNFKEPLQNVFSCAVMKELTELFPLLEKDSSIKAVLLHSEGSEFSRGLDIGYLIRTEGAELKNATQELSECLKIFLKTLLCFTKPIIAAVHGDVLGLGVMLLPVFDVVVAQTGTSFMAPYGHFGYLPEGLKAFSSCRTLKPRAHTDLLLLGKRISCQNALEYGLITEQVEPNRLLVRAQLLTKTVATQSSQALQSIKNHLRQDLLNNLDTVLAQEQKQHVKQWATPECQQMFKEFVSKGGIL